MKRGGSLNSEDIILLEQLIQSSEEAFVKFEDYYRKKDYENFMKVKKFLLEIQKKIEEVVR